MYLLNSGSRLGNLWVGHKLRRVLQLAAVHISDSPESIRTSICIISKARVPDVKHRTSS